MKNLTITLSVICLLSITLSCKKKNECEAGSGGSLTLVVFPQHHGKTIYNKENYPDTVYVKYNAKEWPGSLAAFDAKFAGESGEDHVHVVGLKCGDYYLYAAGCDTSIYERVAGGIPFTTTQQSGEVDLNLPVTEDECHCNDCR